MRILFIESFGYLISKELCIKYARKMYFRQLTIDDYEDYLTLINEFRKTSFTREQFVSTLKYIQQTGDIWVGMENDDMIATATIFYEKKLIFDTCVLAHVEDVCVHSSKRGMGYGKLLIKFLLNQAKEHNSYKFTLDCSDSNVGFYESCGLSKRGNQMCFLLENK